MKAYRHSSFDTDMAKRDCLITHVLFDPMRYRDIDDNWFRNYNLRDSLGLPVWT